MTYTEIQNVNISGIDGIIVYISTALPFFIPIFLLFLWLGLSAGIYFGTKKSNGQADIWTAFSASGFLTLVVTTIFTLTSGIINNYTLVFAAILLFFSIIALFIGKRTG